MQPEGNLMAIFSLPRLTGGLAALVLAPGLAFGHAAKTETTPADGATLASAPAAIEMAFDTPVRVTLVRLTDAAGERYEVDYTRGQPGTEFTATPADLPPGDYTVEWRGLSHDGHPTSGTFSFTID
jgi:methionine-rich copper-binding protein CopC